MNKLPNHKMQLFFVAYWHAPRFKKKAGGLIRIYELADNLTKLGHNVILILPKIGFPKKQTIAKIIEILFIDLALINSKTERKPFVMTYLKKDCLS